MIDGLRQAAIDRRLDELESVEDEPRLRVTTRDPDRQIRLVDREGRRTQRPDQLARFAATVGEPFSAFRSKCQPARIPARSPARAKELERTRPAAPVVRRHIERLAVTLNKQTVQ